MTTAAKDDPLAGWDPRRRAALEAAAEDGIGITDSVTIEWRPEQEPGWDVVATATAVEDVTVSSVNYSERLQKAARLGVQPELVDSRLDALGITASQFGRLDARLAASFSCHGPNLSLGDRACLAGS